MTVQVIKDITVNDLRKGDVVVGRLGKLNCGLVHCVVDGVVKKQVWATVSLTAATGYQTSMDAQRVRLDEAVTVQRTEKTEEERAEETRIFEAGQLRRMTDEYAQDPAVALEEKIVKARDEMYMELVSHWTLDKFLSAQALYKIGREVQHGVEMLRDADHDHNLLEPEWVKDDDERLLTAWADWYRRNVTDKSRYPRDPLSRSSSMTSNMFEDLDRWAIEYVVDKFKWYVYAGTIEDRAAKIQAKIAARNKAERAARN